MSNFKKILFALSCFMIILYITNYFFNNAELLQTLLGIVPMILLIIITLLKENQKNEKIT